MSVFSINPKEDNPVTLAVLDDACQALGVTIKDEEREDYRKLLAVFHESAEELMKMPGSEEHGKWKAIADDSKTMSLRLTLSAFQDKKCISSKRKTTRTVLGRGNSIL